MTITVIFLFVLVLRTSASFFEEFSGSMSTVEDSFEKLLNDVVSDVKVTIDCAILAVEHVLSLGGMFSNGPSEYEKRCKGETESNVVPEDNQDVSSETSPSNIGEFKSLSEISKSKEDIANKINDQINSTISRVNKTLCNILDKNDAQAKLENAKSVLKNETDRLTEVSTILRQELDNISKDVRKKFDKFNFEDTSSSVKNVWNDMKFLREIEKDNKNSPEAEEVSHILDEVLNVLHINETSTTVSDDDKIKEIMKDLEKESNDTFIDEQLLNWDTQDTHQQESVDTFPRSFKEISKSIHEETATTKVIKPHSNLDKGLSTTSTEMPPADAEYVDYDSFFDFMSEGSESHKELAEHANSIIKDSKYSESIMSNLGDSERDDPELFDFSNF